MRAPGNWTASVGIAFVLAAAAREGKAEIPFASAHAGGVEVPSAPDAWGGPRSGAEPTLSDRVVGYRIRARLDPARHVVDGDERLSWKNRSDREVSSVYLHLYLNAFESPRSTLYTEQREHHLLMRDDTEIRSGDFGRIELGSVEQNGVAVPSTFVHPDGGPDEDHTVVRLDLPAAVPPGATTALDIRFHDQLPRLVARTGWFGNFHMVAQWFPKIGVLELPGERGATGVRWNVHEFHTYSEFYADWGEYDVSITVPKEFQVASAGVEEGPPVEEGGFVTHRFVQGDIHDFAWMAASDFAPPLDGEYDGPGSPHVRLRVFYPPEYTASAAPALRATIDSIAWFSKTLGPYPYRTSTCIIPPFNALQAGGMEYQTLFTAMGYPRVEPDTFSAGVIDFVVIHEFGHGYFYGILASNEFEEPMLDEGLNEYWDFRMLTARGQRIHLTTPWFKWIGLDPSGPAALFSRETLSIRPRPPDPIASNAWDRMSTESYSAVYSRTALVMHDLEQRLGADVMDRAFRTYYERWRFRHPSVADFRAVLVETAAERRDVVEQVFRENVFGATVVDDRIDALTSESELSGKDLTFEDGRWVDSAKPSDSPPFRTTVTVRRDGARVPQTVVVRFEDGSTETVRWDGERAWERFTFVKPVKATSAEIDPDQRVHLDVNKLNDGRTLEPRPEASRRWSVDFGALAQVLFSLLEAL
jgi:Peptidase family M1 domain